jgi:hypothetical protein
MSDLKYIPANPPSRPFRIGDDVQVLDRRHKVLGTRRVTKSFGGGVMTDCGRRWTKSGKWIGEDGALPFPSIRLVDDAPDNSLTDPSDMGVPR